MRGYFLVGLVSLVVIFKVDADVKCIAHGWDLLHVTLEEVLANAEKFDRTALDGVTLMIDMDVKDGRHITHSHAMTDGRWPRGELAARLPILRAIAAHRSLRESFLSSWWEPAKRLDWRDDRAWSDFAANMGTLAYLAKEGGLPGILVDNEDYPKAHQYEWNPIADGTYAETVALARQRGREVFGAIFKEYPSITFLSFWLYAETTGARKYFDAESPRAMARRQGDLWQAFLDGMLDVMPAEARIIDGDEGAYFYSATRGDFYRSAAKQRKMAPRLVSPENAAKCRSQLLVGFGLYIDSYVKPEGNRYYIGPIEGSRLRHFGLNLAQAGNAADGYVWLYGEKHSWIDWEGVKDHRWEKCGSWDLALGGFTETALDAKEPRRRLARLVAAGENLIASGFTTYAADPKATGAFSESELVATGPLRGSFLVDVKEVRPGERYVFSARGTGNHCYALVCWTKDGTWNWEVPTMSVEFLPCGEGLLHGLREVTVPKGVNGMRVQLQVRLAAGERCRYQDVACVKVTGFSEEPVGTHPAKPL